MASIRKRARSNGAPYYEIRVQRSRNAPQLTKTWDPPKGWSERSIQNELKKVAGEFEVACRSGEVLSKKERAAKEKEEADKKEEAALAQAKIPSFKSYVESIYLPTISATYSKNTLATYKGQLNHWIFPAFGEQKLSDITTLSITTLFAKMQEQGLSRSSVLKIRNVLSSIFSLAVTHGMVSENPIDKIPSPRARKDEEILEFDDFYTAGEVIEILKRIAPEPLKWRTYINLAGCSGARRGELCGLQWEFVNFDTNEITFAYSLGYTPEHGIFLTTTKGRRSRTLKAPDHVMTLLAELKASAHPNCNYVFTQENGLAPMHPDSPTKYFKKLEKRYDIPPSFHPHRMRHSFATNSLEEGAPLNGVSDALGHVNTATATRVYIHASKKAQNIATKCVQRAYYGESDT